MNSWTVINWLFIQRASTAKKENTTANDPGYLKKVNWLYWWMNFQPAPVKYWPGRCRTGAGLRSLDEEHLERVLCRNSFLLEMVRLSVLLLPGITLPLAAVSSDP